MIPLQTTEVDYRLPAIVGTWRFSREVSYFRLLKQATHWESTCPAYIQIYLRSVGDQAYGIGFIYRLPSDNISKDMRAYLESTARELKKRFGNQLVGWDVAAPILQIKAQRH